MTQTPYTVAYAAMEQRANEAQRLYDWHCRNMDDYRQLPSLMQRWDVAPDLSQKHLDNRGKYEHYPARMATLGKDRRGDPIFVSCANCGRAHCTDAWGPLKYRALADRLRITGTNTYYCRDESECVKGRGLAHSGCTHCDGLCPYSS